MLNNKIIFVSAVADFKGGAEKCLQQFMSNPSISPRLVVPSEGELSSYARAHSIPVDVVDFGRVNEVKRPFKLSAIVYAGIDAFKVSRRINKLAKHYGIACIHSNGLKTHGILSLPSTFNRIPVLCHIHDIPYTLKEKLFWRFLSLSCKRLVLVSRHCWGSKKIPKNVSLMPNGINVQSQALSDKKLTSTLLSIGFVGRIHPYKGLHLAVKWLAAARQKGFQFQFHIRGEAAASEQGYEQMVRKLIDDNGLKDSCFFEGRINAYSKVYAGLDITLMPSVVAEPFGLVAIESFDQGVPCIAYPSGALPSIIEHGQSGYLCENEEGFIASLTELVSSEEKYNGIRKSAHERLKSFYSLDSLYLALNKEYTAIACAE